MFQNRLGFFHILLSSLAAGLLLVGILSGAGTSLADSPAATVVTMGNEQLSFSGQPVSGSIVASGGGEDVINPGFNLSSGQETGGWSGNPDLSFGTDSNGQPTLSGNVTELPQNGTLSAAPTQATVTVAVGDQLVVLTGDGSYYLVNVTAASPESVHFSYQAGTIQPIAAPQPTVTTQKSITVTVGGQTVNFLGALATGTASTTGGGFSFQSGQEGSSGDISVSADNSGQLVLSGDFAVMKQDQDGSYTSDVPSQQTAAISSADNSDDFIFQSGNSDYVFVELDTVSTDSVQFSYMVGPAPSSQPTTTVQFPSAVTVGNAQVTFQGQPATGSIAASGGGYDVINPGFNFSSGQETSSGNGTTDVTFGTDSSGEPTLSGNVAELPQSGTLSAAPTQATVAVSVGDQLVVLASDGTYYVVAVTAASPESVRFQYLAGTVQAQPSPSSQALTVTIGGQQETFPHESATGTVTTGGGGFSFQSGQETPGSSGDISISTDSNGQLILSGDFAVMQQGQDGVYTAVVPTQQSAAISSNDNSKDLIFQSSNGNYVLVQLDNISGDSVQFNYIGGATPSPQTGTPSTGPQLLTLTDTPVVLHGRTFVPMRELFEALGATVQWDGEYQVVTATKGDTNIKLQIGNLNAYINGNQQQLDDSPFIQNGRTFVPLRFAAEALGENVAYDASTTKVTFGNYYFYINPDKAPQVNPLSPNPTPNPQQPNPGSQNPSGTFTADSDHYVGDGLDVTAVASLADGGVNGTIEVTVTVNAPTGVSDVGVGQSYDEFGQTIMANLSQLSQSGSTWTFALFADQLNKNQPFQVRLYKNALSGSGQPAFATIIFNWPTNLLQYMAS